MSYEHSPIFSGQKATSTGPLGSGKTASSFSAGQASTVETPYSTGPQDLHKEYTLFLQCDQHFPLAHWMSGEHTPIFRGQKVTVTPFSTDPYDLKKKV